MRTAILISLGAVVGANARYWLGLAIAAAVGTSLFPWSTFLVNVTGSALLGTFVGFVLRLEDPSAWRLLFAVGFCGSYTTFSTLSSETFALLRDNALRMASVYVVTSMIGGTLMMAGGYAIGRVLARM